MVIAKVETLFTKYTMLRWLVRITTASFAIPVPIVCVLILLRVIRGIFMINHCILASVFDLYSSRLVRYGIHGVPIQIYLQTESKENRGYLLIDIHCQTNYD